MFPPPSPIQKKHRGHTLPIPPHGKHISSSSTPESQLGFGGDNPGEWSPHLSGTKLPVPCIGRMQMIAGQAQSAHVHRVSHLRKEKSMLETALWLHFNPPSYPPSVPHPAGLLRNPNIPIYTEGHQIKSNKSHRQRKSKGPHTPPPLPHIAWLRGAHKRKGEDPGTGREE